MFDATGGPEAELESDGEAPRDTFPNPAVEDSEKVWRLVQQVIELEF